MTDVPRAALCAVAKNEAPYLHEWIAYHAVLGFDEILVYDNESTDGSAELLSNLNRHGLVTPFSWRVNSDRSPQFEAYMDALHRLGADFGWVAFIDLDEFFVLPRHDTIHDFINEYHDMDAIGVNWKNFGSSGLDRFEPELVIDRFRRCSERNYPRNRRVKVLARTAVIARPGTHTCKLTPPAQYLHITGTPIQDGRSERVSHDIIRLNHYYTKSREEWEWKRARGRGGKPESTPERKYWYPDFAARDRNEALERDIVKQIPRVRALMERTAGEADPAPATPRWYPEQINAPAMDSGRYEKKTVEFLASIYGERASDDYRVAELGIWKGATSLKIAEVLDNRGELHLFDYQDNVDDVVSRLKIKGYHNVFGWGSSYRYLDSYNWSLKKLLEAHGSSYFDYVYLDGAHTWAIDALAFFLCDMLLRPGGHIDVDDYGWRLRHSSLAPDRVPATAEMYTDEQIDDRQVKAIVDLLVRPHPAYEEIVPNRIFRKR